MHPLIRIAWTGITIASVLGGCRFGEQNAMVDAGPATTDAPDAAEAPDAAGRDAGPAPKIEYGTMLTIPAGAFWMGCYDLPLEACRYIDENGVEIFICCGDRRLPRHFVTVPAFRIDQTEVTVGAYEKCVASGKCIPGRTYAGCNYSEKGRENHPINCAQFKEAKAFCAFAGKRMCTEAEWEYAARGSCAENGPDCERNMRVYPWGDEHASCAHAILREYFTTEGSGCGLESTAPVGSRPSGASPYGVLDMAGNAYEITADCWHDSFVGAPSDGSAWAEEDCVVEGVVKGGSFESGPIVAQSSNRSTGVWNETCCGFRCCSDP